METPTIPPLRSRAALAAIARLPQGVLSRGFGRLADLPLPPPLRRPFLGTFARLVGADPSEAAEPLTAYRSLNAFFVRRLRPGSRSWPADPRVIAAPVDGTMGMAGRISAGGALQAKGRPYSIARLLGDEQEAARFDGGAYATFYLAPRDYHRVHAPAPGRLVRARHVPGALLPVNPPAVAHLPELFCRNERVVAVLDTAVGRCAVVAVGAYNVGRISTAFDPGWRDGRGTNRGGTEPVVRRYDPPLPVETGDELMAFHLGSTVILLLPPGLPAPVVDLAPAGSIRLGTPLVTGERKAGG